MKESLIHPNCLPTPVTDTFLQLFSLSQLVRALLNDEFELVSQSGEVSVEIDQLLYFEPYTYFSGEMLRKLFAEFENSSEKYLSESFLNKLSKTSHTKVDQLKQVLSVNSAHFQAALARAPPF